MVFFDDLNYRAIGSVGHASLFSPHNDRGFDSCNHDWDGALIMAGAGIPAQGYIAHSQITDIAPTVLTLMNQAIDPSMAGKSLL
ncbi:MAG: hypothetical protein IPJ88_00605 [Myxococcales bacterium]|nr:MAG: hypothetical protein IPJ88_00605 [Myxococcales bacterium]